ncbi:MAG: hypothetical protein GY953_14350, partial [bacterium]|nr:hypothetical protein [bacterium]
LGGLPVGTLSALIAIAPAFTSRGGHLSVTSLASLLALVLFTGLISSILATAATIRAPLLPALQSE